MLEGDGCDDVNTRMDNLRATIHLFPTKGMKKRTYTDFRCDVPTVLGIALEAFVNTAHSQEEFPPPMKKRKTNVEEPITSKDVVGPVWLYMGKTIESGLVEALAVQRDHALEATLAGETRDQIKREVLPMSVMLV